MENQVETQDPVRHPGLLAQAVAITSLATTPLATPTTTLPMDQATTQDQDTLPMVDPPPTPPVDQTTTLPIHATAAPTYILNTPPMDPDTITDQTKPS